MHVTSRLAETWLPLSSLGEVGPNTITKGRTLGDACRHNIGKCFPQMRKTKFRQDAKSCFWDVMEVFTHGVALGHF